MKQMINSWVNVAPIREIALKTLHVKSALLLQKPSKNSKFKDHVKSFVRKFERKFDIWKDGDINDLLEEGNVIQNHLKLNERRNHTVQISKKFKQQLQKDNDNGAHKVLTNNVTGGVSPLTDETLQLLKLKYPDSKETFPQALLLTKN